MVKYVFLTCLLILPWSVSLAFQTTPIPFSWDSVEQRSLIRNFTIDDGLPLNSINKILPHPNGYLYFTTFDGLIRFDGKRFTSYNTANTPGLKSNRLISAIIDGDQAIWMTDSNWNLYLFKNGTVENFQDYVQLPDLRVQHIVKDAEGNIWAATNKGLYHQQLGMDFKLLPDTDSMGDILGLDAHPDGAINFLTSAGFFTISKNHVIERLPASKMTFNPEDIFRIQILDNGDTWFFGREHTLYTLSPNNNLHEIPLPNDTSLNLFNVIKEDSLQFYVRSNLGYYTIEKGTYQFTRNSQTTYDWFFLEYSTNFTEHEELIQVYENSLYIAGDQALSIDHTITEVAIDSEGSIWLGTTTGGLYQVTKQPVYTIGKNIHPSISNVYSIFEDSDRMIWFSGLSPDIGIGKISNQTIQTGITGILFNTITELRSGNIYATSFTIVYELTDMGWEQTNIQLPNIISMFETIDNKIWAGTTLDAFLIEQDTAISFLDLYGVRLGKTTNIIPLNQATTLFLTSGRGIGILEEDELSFIDKSSGLSSNQIRDAYVQAEDTLWVVTEDFGLNRVVFHPQQSQPEITAITENDGLIDNSTHRMLKDDYGFFWINSNNGIMRIEAKELNAYADGLNPFLNVQVFSKEDGLTNPEGNGGVQNAGIITRDGKLLFPSQAGILYTRPEWHLTEKNFQLQSPRVEYLNYSDTLVNLAGKTSYHLPQSARNIQVQFTAPTFSTPDKLILEYKLEGVNEDWQRVGTERVATFTNLSGGEKSFLMRGRLIGDTDYVKSSFHFFIPLKFYETMWFKIFAALSFLGALVLSARISIRQAKRRESKLEDKVQLRTKELTQRTLELEESRQEVQQSLKKIQKLDEVKSEFFTNFTHELRTPLSLILAPLEDMLESDQHTSSPQDRNLSLMKRNAERLKELINQLLDVSKLNSGELTLSLQPVALPDFTRQISSQFEHILQKKQIIFSVEESDPIPALYMDSRAWEHIIVNLLSNAVKFTSNNGSVSIFFEDHEEIVSISVKDNGPGISEEDLPHIFDAYYQGKGSISKAGGTGIGLSLVHGLVTRMKGSIDVNSEPRQGTEFIIKLRKGCTHFSEKDLVSQEPIELLSPPLKVPVNETESEESTKVKTGYSVLLVEDNDDFREYIVSVIQEYYEVQTATNGKEGLEILESFKPDIILSDIMMPKMDGYEMMKEIRSHKQFKHIPFVFLSAKDSARDIEEGLNNGADIYLTKPIQKRLLLTQVKALLRREERINDPGTKTQSNSRLFQQIIEIIERHLGNPDLNIDMIADAVSMSKSALYRNWKKESEVTLNQLITQYRMEEAIRLITEEKLNFSEASSIVGYTNPSYFSQAFKREYGKPPQEYFSEQS